MNIESGFYDSCMMKGSNYGPYITGFYIVDVLHSLMILPTTMGFNYLFGYEIPGFLLITVIWAFTNPFFIYFLVYWLVYARKWRGSTVGFGLIVVLGFASITSSQISTLYVSPVQSSRQVGDLLVYIGSFLPQMNWTNAIQTGQEAAIKHLRESEATVSEGTSIYGQYGIKFSLISLIVNNVAYCLLMLIPLIGCCTRSALKSNLSPEAVTGEDEQIKAERLRIADQISD